MDLNLENPPLDLQELYDTGRPIRTSGGERPPTRLESQGKISTISEGCDIRGKLENCVLSPGVRVGHGSYLMNSVIFNDNFIRFESK